MAPRKTPTKQAPTPEVEPEETEPETPVDEPTPEVEPEETEPETPVDEPTPEVEPAPPGYMWVQRRKPVQLGGVNPQWAEPQLIDVKSFAELEPQGWRAAE